MPVTHEQPPEKSEKLPVLEATRIAFAVSYLERLREINPDQKVAEQAFRNWLSQRLANDWQGSQISIEDVISIRQNSQEEPSDHSLPRIFD